MKYLLAFLILITTLSTHAEVITDGTLGQHINLSGSDFQITPDLGQQHGGNLFHSFQNFNLNSSESAIFSGPNSVQNIISRVTGGNPSNIDGLIQSTIPNADMYFLNPYGIMFGANAKLDVQGSFHASTADYLRLGENGRFDARNPNDSLLTVAPIASFGFLNNPHGKIEVNGRGRLNESGTPRALLQVPDGKSLSLIGGEIHFSQGLDELPLEGLINYGTPEEIQAAQYRDQRFSQLYAPGGYINLVSIQRAGEIALTKNGIYSTATQGGNIQLEQQAYISSTGKSGGNVFIRAGKFTMDDSTIYARTLGIQDGGMVDIQADNIKLDNFSKIRGGTENTGDGTDIQLSASESIHISNDSPLNTYAGDLSNTNQQLGDAGHIRLQANNIEINRDYSLNGVFSTDTYGTGRGGDLSMIAENNLNIVDSYIQVATWGDNEQVGDSGNIYLRAKNLNVKQGTSLAIGSYGSGNAGQLKVEAQKIYLSGLSGNFSSILITTSNGQGNSGAIIIQADEILLEGGAYLDASNYGEGNSGNIDIQLTGDLIVRGASAANGWVTGIYSNVFVSENEQGGKAGNIHIQAQTVRLEKGGKINARSLVTDSTGSSQQASNITLDAQKVILSGVNPYGEMRDGFGSVISADRIQINADSVAILDGALIESGTDNNSQGGDIQIQATESITIQGDASQISLQDPLSSQQRYLSRANPKTYNQSTSGIYANSTSKAENSGDSGNITLSTPYLRLSQGGQVSTASQGGGKAGHITLNVSKLELRDNALIRSNSSLDNQFEFESQQVRDTQLLSLGTVVKTNNVDDGKAVYQINLGNTLVNLMPFTQVEDEAALAALPEQINMANNGDIVKVAGNGHRFIYVNYEYARKNWRLINETNRVVLPHHDASLNKGAYVNISHLPYTDGTLIHVEDIGNGKAADYVYVVTTYTDGPEVGLFKGEVFRIKYYQVKDTAALHTLSDSTDVFIGTQVDVAQAQDGNPARFVFDGTDWVNYGTVLEVADITAREALEIAKPGHIAHLPTGNSIYTGNEWINLGQTYRVNNLAERNALKVQHGDLVKVADTGNGRFDAFVYANGKWIQQIRGGNAGTITIRVSDEIHLSNNSEITTEAKAAGGGQIEIKGNGLFHIVNSKISSSVQENAGNGGNLTINPNFIVLENGKILAQADKGNGGKVNIDTTGIYNFSQGDLENFINAKSSGGGIDGEIEITSLDTDVSGQLFTLSTDMIDASDQIQTPCTSRIAENLNSFVIVLSEGTSNESEDLLPSRPYFSKLKPLTGINKGTVQKFASNTGCKLKRSINR